MTRILLVALLMLPTPLLAHGLHDAGTFLSGALHPVGGADHVLAMLAIGLLAAQRGGRALWALPLAFVGAMLAGGIPGAAGLPLPAVEPMVLTSTVLLGVLVALARPVPLAAVAVATALFGAAHGWAHGAEGPQAGLALYAAGFALVTAGLHGLGLLLGRSLPALAVRGLGAAATGAGLALAFA